MKTILVPTDFSKAARNAAEYAVAFAKGIKADVLLFHVYHVPVPVATDVPPVMVTTPDELQKESEKQLKKEAERLKKKTRTTVKYVAKMGLAVDEILNVEKNASFIVMGMQGASRLNETLMGSITTATLRKAKTPVLVIPQKASYKKPVKIAFACDYDPRTDSKILDTLKSLTKTFGSKVFVVNVKGKENTASVNVAAGKKLENKLKDVEHIYCFSESEDLVEGINAVVKEKEADMIAIIPHRYNLMERLFHKSISKKMAFHTHVPLLVLPDNHKSVATYFI